MRIALTVTGASLDSHMDPRFGRCTHFLVVETETMELEAIENPNMTLGGGAGIQSAQLLASKNVQFVLTGNCGPNAYQTLNAAGIGVIVGCSGTARDVVEQFKAGRFGVTSGPNVPSHSGTAGAVNVPQGAQPPQQPPGTGPGMGMGRGQGRGMGRGMGGGGMGRGMGGGQGRGRGMGQGGGGGGGWS